MATPPAVLAMIGSLSWHEQHKCISVMVQEDVGVGSGNCFISDTTATSVYSHAEVLPPAHNCISVMPHKHRRGETTCKVWKSIPKLF